MWKVVLKRILRLKAGHVYYIILASNSQCDLFPCACMNFCVNSYNDSSFPKHINRSTFQNNETASNNISNSRNVESESLLTCNNELDCNEGSALNLQLCKKGMNIGVLNVQGLCSRDMTKNLEIELMMTSEENANVSILSLCETKLKDDK